jgi:soluble lytic murein transglycosylase
LIKNSSKPVDALKRLYDSHPKERLVAGDYLLWQLAQLDSDNALLYYQILLKHYPDRDYAPESSWNLMWPALREGQTSAFLAKADRHLERYPHSRSASKALFWKAKLMERQGKTAEAIRHYEEILRRYPNVYYAFRAYGRLQALTHHRADPGWTTYPARSAQVYPPDARQMSLSILPADGEKHLEQAGKLSGEEARYRLAVAKELEATGVADDVALLFKESTGKVPASVASWQEALDGDRAKGMRTIRDDLDERFKTGYLPTENELKLLYPVYFSTPIARQAPANQLDPYLVQSLMREESYFNEFAVSGSNARGLMQLMPATAQEVAKTVGIPNFTIMTLFSPDTNIRLGCRYLGYLHKRFAGQSMPSVGAYNGGPNAMQRWIDKSSLYAQDPDMFVETIPYDQTRDYIKKVYTSYWNYQRLYNPQSPFVR